MPETRAVWHQILLFIGGMIAILVVGWLGITLWPKQDLPEGWLRLTPPHDVMALVEVQGEVWAGGRDGIVALDRRDGSLLREVGAEVPLKYVTGIVQSPRDGSLWISHMNGVSHYDGESWQTLTEAEGLTGGRGLSVLLAHDGTLWIGTEYGVTHYTETTYTRYSTADGLVTEGCAYLFEDSLNHIWCGNGYKPEAGVSVFDGESWRPIDAGENLAHPMLNTMLESPRRTLWFGTGFSAEGGLSIYDGDRWRTLTKADGLAGAKVRFLFQDRAGVVWVGSEYNGILRMGSPTWQIFTPENGLAGWEVKAMLQDSQDTLWLGTELGLTRISNNAWLALGSADAAPKASD